MSLACINGKILHVDLTQGATHVETPTESFYRTYAGGGAMGVYYVLKNTPPGADALSPENVLTLFTSMPTGLSISGQSRLCVNARLPLTGLIGDSQSGGFFPARMKNAGYDGIVITGRSPQPVYLWVHDGEVELRPAVHLWGKITGEVEDILKRELDDANVQVLQCGPAGEKGVRFAALISMANRANGRTGMGAVMASKNLKAVVVQGSAKMRPADPKALSAIFMEGTRRLPKSIIYVLQVDGTAGGVGWQQFSGGFPTFNYNQGQFEFHEEINGTRMTETILKKRDTCFSCTVRCKRMVETEFEGSAVLPRYGGPEYETIGTFGSLCGVHDLDAISLANQLCNQYGMDTISCGAAISWAMECYEKGIISTADTGGIELRFGNTSAMVQMVELIANRQGFGDLLALGSAEAARRLWRGSEDCLVTGKGQELPGHMPQVKRAMGLIYAVNPFGADHTQIEHDGSYEEGAGESAAGRLAQLGLTTPMPRGVIVPERARLVALTQKFIAAANAFSLCKFVWGVNWSLYGPTELVDMMRAVTGWDWTIDEILQLGERSINMMRQFNARNGFNRSHDQLSEKFFRPLGGTGPSAGVAYTHEEFEGLKDEYYRLMGWDIATGNPNRAKLEELGLGWAV